MKGTGEDRSDAGRERAAAFTLVRFEREIFPFLQSTQWVPRTASDERTRIAGGYDIVLEHGLAEKIRRAARRCPGEEAVGILYGRGCECPWTRRLWIRVEAFELADAPVRKGAFRRAASAPSGRSVAERLSALLDTAPPNGLSVVGSVHVRPGAAVALSADEGGAHARGLTEPWQLSLLLSSGSKDRTAGVFGRDEDGRLRGGLLRPFYEMEPRGIWRPGRHVSAANYRIVERADELPGRSRAVAELERRKVPAMVNAGCIVFGVALGLVLSYELSRASQPGGFLSDDPAFASPLDEILPAGTPDPLPGLARLFESNVDRFEEVHERSADAAAYCEDLANAYESVQSAFVNLIRRRDRLDAESVTETVEMAIQTKGRVDSRFAATGCRRRQ